MDVAIFGVIVADLIGQPIDLRQPPPAGTLRHLQTIELTPGGNVCNVGIAHSRLGLKVAGAGMVGSDILGRALCERLSSEKVDVSHIRTHATAQTSSTIVAVEPGGQRTFFHAPGATTHLSADVFRECFPLFRQCAWLHLAYFGLLPALTPDLPVLLSELKQVAPGLKIALDTLDPPAEKSLLDPILPLIDLFAPSRPEAITLTGQTDPSAMIAHFRARMPRGIIGIKLDQEGCILDDDEKQITIPAYKVNILDTTGAGDAWFAGLLTGLRAQLPLKECGHLANRIAADSCTALGGSTGVQSLELSRARL